MARYQLGDGFCTIEQDGARIITVEPDGTEHVEELASAYFARTRLRILCNQRLRAGWKPAAEVVIETRVVKDACNPELEAAVLEDPDDVGAWQVYGDWLQLQGDPRGTHIALRVAAQNDPIAATRLANFEKQNEMYLRSGFIEPALGIELGWGFIDAVRIAEPQHLAMFDRVCRFVRRIEISKYANEPTALLQGLALCAPRTLRELSIARYFGPETLAPIEVQLARLRVLDLECVLSPACFAELSHVPLPQLSMLAINMPDFHDDDREELIEKACAELFARPGLDRLVELRVYRSYANIPEVLGWSPLAAQLEKLSLPMLHAREATSLADHVEQKRFPRLREIELPVERLDPKIFRTLAAHVRRLAEVPQRYAVREY